MTTEVTDGSLLPPLETGLYPGVGEEEYHADRRAISQSGMKIILQSPAHYRWQTDNPRAPKKEFDFGSAAHALVLGVGPKIEVIEIEVEATRDGRRQKIIADNHMFRLVQEAEDRARAAGNIPLLPAEYQHVLAMADKLSEHQLAMELLSVGEPEITAYAQDEQTGVWIKGRFDWLSPATIVDLKTSTTSEPDAFIRKAIDYGYDLQSAVYLDLAAAIGHTATGWAWICQEKTEPYVVTVIVPPAELIDRGRKLKQRALEIYADCLAAGSWPGYAPDTEFVVPEVPAWALKEVAEW